VKSPVDGVVLQLAVRTEHEVVKPGDVVARVVPHGEQLQAEVQIQPEDIGHIGINDYAELRFAAFDPSVYGKIRGKVVDIAPYTLENDQKHLYYRVRVGFDPMDAVGGYMPMNVQPGLVVDAQIVTGAKSLIHYMLKPIYRGLDSAFAER
jgi:HlyD family secretion protein/adhesin transport system membrane fusion protein